jgi:hypothetical protein
MAAEHETREMRKKDAPLRDKLGWGPTKRPDDMDKAIERDSGNPTVSAADRSEHRLAVA